MVSLVKVKFAKVAGFARLGTISQALAAVKRGIVR